METPETILIGGAVLKIVLDMGKGIIPSERKKWIPLVAVVFGLAWSLLFFQGEVAYAIYWGVAIGATAVGVHEFTKLGKKKVN